MAAPGFIGQLLGENCRASVRPDPEYNCIADPCRSGDISGCKMIPDKYFLASWGDAEYPAGPMQPEESGLMRTLPDPWFGGLSAEADEEYSGEDQQGRKGPDPAASLAEEKDSDKHTDKDTHLPHRYGVAHRGETQAVTEG